MYAKQKSLREDCWYNTEHIKVVQKEIEKNFDKYFDKFIETSGGRLVSKEEFEKLKEEFNVCLSEKEIDNRTTKFLYLINDAKIEFEKDRQKYIDILDSEVLEEWTDDPACFKSKILKNECPIIHSTLANKKAKELDKYRYDFSIADAEELLNVVTNLYEFAKDYINNFYKEETYENITSINELELEKIDDLDDYTAYGVIGGGIRSHMLYKLYPSVFPNRSRNAIWALWYLTNKCKFDCSMDSEFIMIDLDKNIVQQNYFYPYVLFVFYSLCIYKLIKEKAKEINIEIDTKYRYVIVDAFLDFIAFEHSSEIEFFKSQISDGGNGYA